MRSREVRLKRGYSIKVLYDSPESSQDIIVLGNYSKSNYMATMIVSVWGVAPTVRENHGQVTGVETWSRK